MEVHQHIFVSGPRANGAFVPKLQKTTSHFDHSHADGSTRHGHPDTGPASYTIDKHDWYAATGLRGGGRKKYTKAPTGEQLPRVELEDWQKTFTVVFRDDGYTAEFARSTGLSKAEWERHRDAFKAAAEGQIPEEVPGEPGEGGAAVARMVLGADLAVIYEYHAPQRRRRGGPRSSS